MKSVRVCQTARFELSDSCPEFLGITSVAGMVLKVLVDVPIGKVCQCMMKVRGDGKLTLDQYFLCLHSCFLGCFEH